MSEHPLEPQYRDAHEFAREMVTLIKFGQESGQDDNEIAVAIRGQIRQKIREWTDAGSPARVWILVEVLCFGVAGSFEDLSDWSESVINALSEEDR